jgi:ssDNA-binding Zn-finger/Zn-ribbon topoisomerase 1
MMKIAMLPLAVLLAGAILMGGCQSPGQVVSSKPVIACPDCSQQVVTSRIKGLDFTRVVCPTCHKVWTLPESAYSDQTIAYYCPQCKELIALCPDCQKLALPPAVTMSERLY